MTSSLPVNLATNSGKKRLIKRKSPDEAGLFGYILGI